MSQLAQVKVGDKLVTAKDLLALRKQEIGTLIPGDVNLTGEQLARIATMELYRQPKLRKCEPLTVLQAVYDSARLGLVIGREAHLVPFGKTCTLVPDYRGYQTLAIRSGLVSVIEARPVFAGEQVEIEYGSAPRIKHTPRFDVPRSEDTLQLVYAVAHLRTGGSTFEVMNMDEVRAIRERSRAKSDGPWVTDFIPMALKTVSKRLCDKRLPMSDVMADLVELDNRAETGEISRPLQTETEDVFHAAASEATREAAEALRQRLTGDDEDAAALAEDAELVEGER